MVTGARTRINKGLLVLLVAAAVIPGRLEGQQPSRPTGASSLGPAEGGIYEAIATFFVDYRNRMGPRSPIVFRPEAPVTPWDLRPSPAIVKHVPDWTLRESGPAVPLAPWVKHPEVTFRPVLEMADCWDRAPHCAERVDIYYQFSAPLIEGTAAWVGYYRETWDDAGRFCDYCLGGGVIVLENESGRWRVVEEHATLAN
jgi:hypothetical protein